MKTAPVQVPAGALWDSQSKSTPMYYLAGYFVFLIAAWVAAWYLHDLTFVRDLGPGATVAYWTVAKLIVWIAPILLIVSCVLKRPAVAYLGLTGFARGARVGCVVGATFVWLSAIVDVFTRTHALPGPSWGMLSALTVAPLFEEVMFRGFALKALEDSGYRFWPANTIAAILFLGLHLPGWHFITCTRRSCADCLNPAQPAMRRGGVPLRGCVRLDHAAHRNASTCRSHPSSRFQLAKIRLTT